MKKIIALLLCCVLCLSLFACGETTPDETQPTDHTHDANGNHVEEVQPSEAPSEESSEPADDHSDHAHVNYKGIVSGSATLQDVEAAEGKAPDFSFEAGGIVYYAYKNVTFESFQFDQVQISFHESYVRVSCTRTTEEGLADIHADWKGIMMQSFGDPSQISEHENVFKWADHTGNYVTLTQLNDTTVQLCYYLVA